MATTRAFIRGLWGDPTLLRRIHKPPDPYCDILKSVQVSVEQQVPIDHVYCFGQVNYDYVRSFGLKADLLDRRAWATPGRPYRGRTACGAIRQGHSHWWHKLRVIAEALCQYDEVVWLDFRAELRQPITEEYWKRRAAGAAFQATLYRQPNYTWAAAWRHVKKWPVEGCPLWDGEDSLRQCRMVPGGGCIYLRDKSIADEWLRIARSQRTWLDHQVMACWFDRLHGGWVGPEKWVESGYELGDYRFGPQVYPPADDQVIWDIPSRYCKRQAE